jgi:hypothetical protein
VPAKQLSARLGFNVVRGRRGRMTRQHREAVLRLRLECEEIKRDGVGRPDSWETTTGRQRLAEGFGFEGGWLLRGGTRCGSRSRIMRTTRP